jgi:hypothetical protein
MPLWAWKINQRSERRDGQILEESRRPIPKRLIIFPAAEIGGERRSENVARGGDRRAVRKRSAHGFAHGSEVTMGDFFSHPDPSAVRSMGVYRHGELG